MGPSTGSLTNFEYVRIMAARVAQLERGAHTLLPPTRLTAFKSTVECHDVAMKEICQRRLNWVIVRPRCTTNDDRVEHVNLQDLSLECIEGVPAACMFRRDTRSTPDPHQAMEVDFGYDCTICRTVFIHSSFVSGEDDCRRTNMARAIDVYSKNLMNTVCVISSCQKDIVPRLITECSAWEYADKHPLVDAEGNVTAEVLFRITSIPFEVGEVVKLGAIENGNIEAAFEALPDHAKYTIKQHCDLHGMHMGTLKGMEGMHDCCVCLFVVGKSTSSSWEEHGDAEACGVIEQVVQYRLKESPHVARIACIVSYRHEQ